MPFLLLCLIGFCTLFSSYLRLPVLPLFAASLGAGLLSIPAGLVADRVGRRLRHFTNVVGSSGSRCCRFRI